MGNDGKRGLLRSVLMFPRSLWEKGRAGTRTRRWAAVYLSFCWAVVLGGCQADRVPGDREWNEFVGSCRKETNMGGHRMHYLDLGKGKPVLLIHGFGDSTYCWNKNVQSLVEAGFHLIVVDQPGLGRSGAPPLPYRFSVENQAGEIDRLTRKLGLSRYAIVGSSMGGAIALYLALTTPERVEKLALFAPVCYRPPRKIHSKALEIPGIPYVVGALFGRLFVRKALEDVYFDDNLVNESMVDEYYRPFARTGFMKILARMRTEFFSREFSRMTRNYSRLRHAALIVWGDHDNWVPPEFGERLCKKLRGSKLVKLKNCGHLPHQERPDRTNPLLIQFMGLLPTAVKEENH